MLSQKQFTLLISGIIICTKTLAQSNDLQSRLTDYITPYVETKNFNGTVLIAQNGHILYEKSFGFSNEDYGVANESSTVYHIASVSKPFTATAILLLEQQGKLSTTDLLSKYIPDYPKGSEITIHHLLTHTSGIPNINDMPEYTQASRFPQTPESLITIFKNKPLDFEPGNRYKYSNSNYNILAYIIEKVSNKSFGEFLNKDIFLPAGMLSTYHHENMKQNVNGMAIGYQSDGTFGLEKSEYLDWSSKVGNGSLMTTASDLLLWDKVLTNETILNRQSIDKMYTDHKSNTGYGCFVKEHLNRKRYYMNGRSPGFTSYFARYPEEGLCVIVLANNYIPVPTIIGMDIAAIVFNKKIESPRLQANPVSSATIEKIVGQYKFEKDFYRPEFLMTVSEKDGRVSIDWGELIPTGELTFIARAFWSDVTFDMNSKGEVIYLDYDGYKGKKVK